MKSGATFLNMAATIDGDVTMFAVWHDGVCRDELGEKLEGFDPLSTPCYSRSSVQSATIRVKRWKKGFAKNFPWAAIEAIHAKNGDHVHTLKEWMLGVEETNRKGETFLHYAGVIEGRDDGAAEAEALWAKVVEAYGLENDASAAEAA